MASVPSQDLKGSVIQVDEQQIRSHVDEVVRSSVEETLKGLLDRGRSALPSQTIRADGRPGG